MHWLSSTAGGSSYSVLQLEIEVGPDVSKSLMDSSNQAIRFVGP